MARCVFGQMCPAIPIVTFSLLSYLCRELNSTSSYTSRMNNIHTVSLLRTSSRLLRNLTQAIYNEEHKKHERMVDLTNMLQNTGTVRFVVNRDLINHLGPILPRIALIQELKTFETLFSIVVNDGGNNYLLITFLEYGDVIPESERRLLRIAKTSQSRSLLENACMHVTLPGVMQGAMQDALKYVQGHIIDTPGDGVLHRAGDVFIRWLRAFDEKQ